MCEGTSHLSINPSDLFGYIWSRWDKTNRKLSSKFHDSIACWLDGAQSSCCQATRYSLSVKRDTPGGTNNFSASNPSFFLSETDFMWLDCTPTAACSSQLNSMIHDLWLHDDVIKWKHFPCYWPFVRGIHRWPVNSPHKGQWRGALMFSLICALNKRLSKQSWGWWFKTPSRSLWRHCNGTKTVTWPESRCIRQGANKHISVNRKYIWRDSISVNLGHYQDLFRISHNKEVCVMCVNYMAKHVCVHFYWPASSELILVVLIENSQTGTTRFACH